MSLTIERSERFQKEYKNFYDRISKLTNESHRKELENLLKKLVVEVRIMDSQHQNLYRKNEMPAMVVDSRNNIQSIRKEISRKLEDCERSNKVN